jgi:hypothetical protein
LTSNYNINKDKELNINTDNISYQLGLSFRNKPNLDKIISTKNKLNKSFSNFKNIEK